MLRPESRPVKYVELGESQKDVLEKIISLLSEAVAMVDEKSHDAISPSSSWLENNRTSRLLFLSGQRGTGKSTVLASLVGSEKEKFFDKLEIKDIPIAILNGLKNIKDRIVWLEPIDLETIPSSSNLLGAILARIEKATEHASSSNNVKSSHMPGAFEIGSGYQDAMLSLQRLQTNLALAWDGNLQARASHLDPDVFAVEAKRVEKSRLSINQELTQTLNKLSEYAFTGSIRNPLFVLLVDDFDLNPQLCIEMLKMLRMISVPRLFTIIVGDISIAEKIIELKTRREFYQMMGASNNIRSYAVKEYQGLER